MCRSFTPFELPTYGVKSEPPQWNEICHLFGSRVDHVRVCFRWIFSWVDGEPRNYTMTKARMQDPIRLFLIDDERIVRDAISSLIRSWKDFQITGEGTVDE